MSELEELFTEEAPSLIGVGADALVENATRLGLTWVLRFGTVQTADPLTVIVDGDTVPVSMVSLTGYLEVGARVSVLIVSSKVHFVIGPLAVAAAVSDEQGTSGTTTSTTYTSTLTGGTACGVAFVAPTSGRVLIANSARMINSGANQTYCGFIVRTGSTVGSGTSVVSEADARALLHTTTAFARFSVTYLVNGLTAGASYNVQQSFRVAAGTGTYANKEIAVIPS